MITEVNDVILFFWTLLRHAGFSREHFLSDLLDVARALMRVGAM